MVDPNAIPEWKEELNAIVGARAHGQSAEILPRLQRLDERHPNVAEINYQLAWTADIHARPELAVTYYEKAIALGLSPNELSGALLGLGSTLRTLGHLDRSAAILESGHAQFPENREFEVFLALTHHQQGKHGDAMRRLIDVLCDTTEDPGLTAYQRTLRHIANELSP